MSAEIERKFLLPAFPVAELGNKEITLISKQYIYQTVFGLLGGSRNRRRWLAGTYVQIGAWLGSGRD